MITKEKIKVFKYYNADIDSFGHGSKKDRKIITDAEFLLIVNLVQEARLIKNNLASREFELNLELKLHENCDTEETIEELKKAAM